jgi:RNA polymerase sigma factor (sigma-70 family)
MTPKELYESNLALINGVVDWVCRRNFLSGAEAEDFKQSVHVKMIADDFRVFRKFKEQSSLKTYLVTVIQRQLLDWRVQKWGKQRSSAEAKRLGKVAIKLEELLQRDGFTVAEACEILLTNHHVALSRAELEGIAVLLPPRTSRPAAAERPEAHILESELRGTRQRLLAALEKIIEELPDEDRLILEMCVLGSRKIAEAARFLGLAEKPLYRRKDQILACLKKGLERRGFSWRDVAEVLGMGEVAWE